MSEVMNFYQRVNADLVRMEALQNQIADCRREAGKLPALEGEATKIERGLRELLKRQDLTSPGNMGWEGRMIHFLFEFRNTVIGQRSAVESENLRPFNPTAEARAIARDALCTINNIAFPQSIGREVRQQLQRIGDCLAVFDKGQS